MGIEHESGASREPERPTVEYEGWQFCDIRLEPSLLQYLSDLGGATFQRVLGIPCSFIRSTPNGRSSALWRWC